jgi:hypothetical protein
LFLEALTKMNRTILATLTWFSLAAGGCAALDGSFVGKSSAPTVAASNSSKPIEYEAMASLPPTAQKEERPSLSANEIWVPGYYQPVAGNWLWHQGAIQEKRDGYTLVPAAYKEENGKVYFTPPKWRRNDLLAGKTK